MMENGDKLQLYDSWKDVISDENFSRGFKFLRRRSIDGGDCKTARLRDIVLEFCDLVNYRDEKSLIGIIKILDDYDEIYGDYQLSVRINRVLDYISNEAVEEYKYANFSLSNKQDAVSIMTVHKSKGLEFNTVFIVKMETKEFPVANRGGKKYWHVLGEYFEKDKEKYQTDEDAERNLFYVAVTRAKRKLYITYQISKQPVSIFVREAAESAYMEINKEDLNIDK